MAVDNKDVLGLLREVSGRSDDLRPAHSDFVNAVLANNKRLWDSRGASVGASWAPLALSTIKWRERHHKGVKPLKYAGARGRQAFNSLTRLSGKYQHLDLKRKSVEVASTSAVATAMQKGGTLRGRKGKVSRVPARVTTGIDRKLVADLQNIYSYHLMV